MLTALTAGITEGATLGLMALGLVLVYKATRVLNLAQGEIGTTSIYVAWLLTEMNIPVAVAVFLALAFAAVLGIVMERIVIRPMTGSSPLSITVVTLGVATVLGGTQFVIWGELPKVMPALLPGQGFVISNVGVPPNRILAFFVTAALGAAFYVFFKKTFFGLGVLAAAQNPDSLRLMGVPLTRVSMFTWAAGGVLAALAGVILAPVIGAFHPFFMTQNLLIASLVAALAGGLTSLPGAFLGGLVVGLVGNALKVALPDIAGVEFVGLFVLTVLVLFFRPRGLLGSAA